MRKILLLAKPRFATPGARHLRGVLRVFEQAGLEVELRETGANRAAGAKAKQAVGRGFDAVVVCGGDGTVFDVLQGIAGTEMPLGIIPFGTGNVLAQNLAIPRRPEEAARWLLTAEPRNVPLGKLTCCDADGTRTWLFAVAAGMGMHAAMMQATDPLQKDRTGAAAYFVAGLKTLFTHRVQAFDMTVDTLDGQTIERRVSEVIAVRVAELNLWRTGADLARPCLRLASVEGASRWRLATASVEGLLLGGGQRDSPLPHGTAGRYESVRRVECRAIPGVKYRPLVTVEADGEILGHSCATMEMAGVSVRLLSQPEKRPFAR